VIRARVQRISDRLVAIARRRPRQEGGFTLIEVIATVAILGIIVVPLGTAMVFGLRTMFDTQEQLARTSDVRQLSAYFPADVQSVDATGVDPSDDNNAQICKADAGQTNLISFVWDEDLGISGQSMARYIATGEGKNSKIIRRFCRGAADPNQPATSENDWTDITLASHFGTSGDTPASDYTKTTDPAAPIPGHITPQCSATSCFIELHGAYEYRLNANRRVPGEAPGAHSPDAPTAVHGVPGNQRVMLYWTEGSANGSPITSYNIETRTNAGSTIANHPVAEGNGTAGIKISGLTNSTSYTFRVQAINNPGNSPWSQWSDVVVPGPTTPDPPTIGTATASSTTNGSASVSWSLPSGYDNGGANLVGYRVSAINAPNAPVVVDVNDPSATTGTVTGLVDNTQYVFQVSARNEYGEGSPSASSNAVVTLPSAPGTPNAQYGGSTGTVTLTFTPPTTGEFSSLTSFRAKVSSRANAEDAVASATACTSGAAGTCTLQVTGLSSGQTYSIAVQAQNAAGWGPLSAPATAEVTPPTVPSSTIAPVGDTNGGYIGQGNPFYVYANASDANGISTVRADVDSLSSGENTAVMTTAGGPWAIGGTSYTYRSAAVTADSSLSSGSKSYSITAIDTFANSGTQSFSVTVDNTPPSVTLTQVNGSIRTFPWNTNAASLTSVAGACSSGAGNNTTITVTVTGPTPQTGTAACSSSSWSYTFAAPITTQGAYTLEATQTDYAGNTGTSGEKDVNLDRTGPTIERSIVASTIDTTVGGYIKSGGSYYVYANVTDAISGVGSVTANVNNITSGSTSVSLTAGSYTVGSQTYNYRSASRTASSISAGSKSYTITATDNAGGSVGPQSFSVTVDSTGPTLAATIARVGVTTGGYLHQGEQYYVYANATDPAGINSSTANVAVSNNVLTTGATATPLTTTDGPWVIGGTSYAYRSSALVANSSISSGNKTYSVSATDSAANLTTSNFTVSIDNAAPAPTVTQVNGVTPAFPYATNADVTSVGGACGNASSDIASVTVTFAGVENETGTAPCASGVWTYTLTSAWSAEGSSTVVVSQDDLAGNTGTSAARTVSIDKTTPVVSDTVMASTTDTTVGGYIKQGGSYYVYANVTDVGSGVSTVTTDASSVDSGQSAVPLSSGTYSVAGVSYNYRTSALTANNPLGAGTKTYTVRAADAAGNSTTTPNQNVTVDNTAPAPSAFSLANGDVTGRIDVDDSFTVTYNSVVNPNTICTGLTDSHNITGVSIVLNGNGSGNGTLNAPGSPCANFFSSVNLGRNYYNTTSTRTLTTTFSWNAASNSVTVTITSLSSTSSRTSNNSPGTPTYTPKSSILDPAGNGMGTSTFTGSSSRF
jgi:prepilin-type N-terminal cleavage/methylation domain-containing protein